MHLRGQSQGQGSHCTLNIGAERFNTAGSTGSESTLAATTRTRVLIYCHCSFFILLLPFSGIHVDRSPTVPSLTTSYAHGTSSTSLQYNTVTQCLQRTVERFPDREAVVFVENGIRKTFAKFQQDVSICVLNIRSDTHQHSIHNSNSVFLTSPYSQVDQAAAGLLALGLKRGDRLGMWGPNTYEWILIQFATAKAGIILVSQSGSIMEMFHFVKHCPDADTGCLFTVSK